MNTFDVLKMNYPVPNDVLEYCIDALDCIGEVDRDTLDIKRDSDMSITFTFNDICSKIYYNLKEERTELCLSVPDDIYRKRIEHFRTYSQYRNKIDSAIFPQVQVIDAELTDVNELSCIYEGLDMFVRTDFYK